MKKKVLALCLCLTLAATAVIGGTLAYFTDSEGVTNTFSMGALHIDLEEPNWVEENAKNLLPGDLVLKDPTVTVKKGSVDCYVRLVVTMPSFIYNNSDFFHKNDDALIRFQGQSGKFTVVGTPQVGADTATLVLKYGKAEASAEKDVPLDPLFTGVKFDGSIKSEGELYGLMSAGDWNIEVKAYAVQFDNTTSESEAFTTAFGDIFVA